MTIDLVALVYAAFVYLPLLTVMSLFAPILLPTCAESFLWIVGSAIANLFVQILYGKYSFQFLDTELLGAMPWFVGDAIFFGAIGFFFRWRSGGQYVPENHPTVEASSSLDQSDLMHPFNPGGEHYMPLHLGRRRSEA